MDLHLTRIEAHRGDEDSIILQELKHIGVMKTPENVVGEDGSDEAWEHP
jgi:hypothetical protein